MVFVPIVMSRCLSLLPNRVTYYGQMRGLNGWLWLVLFAKHSVLDFPLFLLFSLHILLFSLSTSPFFHYYLPFPYILELHEDNNLNRGSMTAKTPMVPSSQCRSLPPSGLPPWTVCLLLAERIVYYWDIRIIASS